jgi:hypothetical protein
VKLVRKQKSLNLKTRVLCPHASQPTVEPCLTRLCECSSNPTKHPSLPSLCCRVASQHLLTTRLGPQHPPRTRLPRVCQLLNAREDKQCHFCPGPHRTNNLHDLMFGRIRGIVQRDVAQLSVISLPLLPPCPAPARDSIIRARLLLFSQERAWAAHQDRVRVDYA